MAFPLGRHFNLSNRNTPFANLEYSPTLLNFNAKLIHVIMLPEKLRKSLEKTVKELAAQKNVYGVALFGSWSRGDAVASSDVDLLVLDREDFPYEYVERIERGGFLIDLNHISKHWIRGPIPPEIDQKLYEMQILYDKDWTLANVKPLIAKSYGSPERVDIRTEAHVVEGDIYLSRATSAFSRHDFMSSHLFATVALENTLKVLVEITMQPFSNGRFIETVESSCTELGKHDLFEDYIKMTGFRRASSTVIKDRLRLFQKIWEEMNSTIKQNGETLASVHFRVRTRLNYYFNDAYLRGVVDRANAMLEAEKTVEALHYLTSILLDIVENYVWLKSFMRKVRIDCTTLIRSLESLEGKGSRNYVNTLTFLELEAIGKSEVAQDVSKARELMLRTRKERKQLIKSRLLKS